MKTPTCPGTAAGRNCIVIAALLTLAPPAAHGTSITKATTGTDLTADTSWTGTAPAASDVATWGNGSLGAGLTLGTDSSWLGISVAGMLSDIDITGAGKLTLGSSGITLTTAHLSAATPVAIGASQTWTTTAGTTLTLTGPVSGTASLTKAGPGTLVLSNATNSFSNNATLSDGVVKITTAGAIGASKTLTITSRTAQFELDGSGGAITLPSGIQFTLSNPNGAIRNSAGTNRINGALSVTAVSDSAKILSDGGALTLAGAITANTALNLELGGTSTGANTVSGQVAGSAMNPNLIKSDAGTWILTNTNPYTGATTVNDGVLQLSGSGKMSDTSGINLNGGSLVLDNTATGSMERIVDNAPLSVNGGSLIYKGSGTANSTETLAAITSKGNQFVTGNPAITLSYLGNTDTGRTATLTAASLVHTPGNAAFLVNGLNLGKDATDVTGVCRIKFTTAPTLVGTTDALATGINAASKATRIVPYLVGEATATSGGTGSASGTANTFVTYHSDLTVGGLRPLNPTDEFTQNVITLAANTRITSATTATLDAAINSLVIAGGDLTITDGKALAVTSGAILFASTKAIKPSSSTGTLALLANEGMVTVNPGLTGALSAKVTGSAGLTKSGAGTLVLSNANIYTGVTTVGGGVLRLNGANALPGGIGTSGGTSALTFNGGVLGLGNGNFTRSLATAGTVAGATFSGPGGWAAYSADRTVNLGGSAAAINTGTAGTGFNGQTLILGAADTTHMVTLENPITLAAAFTIQVDDGAAVIDATLSRAVSGAFPLTKTGKGTLALTTANALGSLANTALVSAGTLLVNHSTTATSSLIVQNGGTLGGTGTINGPVTVNSGGTLQPTVTGTPGTLTLASATSPAFFPGAKLTLRATVSVLDKVVLTNSAAVFNCDNLDLEIADYTGTLSNKEIVHTANAAGISGTFRSVTAPTGYTVIATYYANSIVVNVVVAGPATRLAVTGFPNPQTAGVAGNVTVTAKDASNITAASYTGTVHFTSSDGAAVLPANYTFVPADKGVHTFTGVTFNTAGTQSITATDMAAVPTITGTQSAITINPSPDKQMLTFTFPTWGDAVIDGSNISLTVPAGTNVTSLAPTYTVSPLATCVPASGTSLNFTSPQTYTVTAQDHSTQDYTVTVTVPAGNYAGWAADPAQGLTAGVNDGPNDDPDFDGIPNLLEFVLGGAPLVAALEILPTLTRATGYWWFEYDRSFLSQPPGTSQIVEYGDDLTGWTEVPIPLTSDGIVTITPGSTSDHVQVTLPFLGAQVFARLKVAQ